MAATPRYKQIADDLRQQIASGELARESQIPTEVELQERYGASRNTVREAVKLLATEGLLESRGGGGGTWVTRAHVPFVTTLSTDPKADLVGGDEAATYPSSIRQQDRRKAGAEQPEVTVLECPLQIAAQLRIEPGEDIVRRRQRRLIDGILWSLQTSYYPMKWVQKGARRLIEPRDIFEGAAEYVANTIGLKQHGYRDLILARQPDDEEKTLFNLSSNRLVVEVNRTSFAEDGTAVRVTVTVYQADRNQLVYEMGVVPDGAEDPA